MKIVASNNAFVYDELASPGFQLVKPQAIVVSSGDEALKAVARNSPELAVLDAEMPGLDGYTVCERIKAEPSTRLTRVILVMQGSISAKQLQRLAACGCDDVVVFRNPGEDLYHHAARLLGLPDPSLGEAVQLNVSITDGGRPQLSARALQLSVRGVMLLVPSPLVEGTRVTLRMHRQDDDGRVEIAGEVLQGGHDPITRSPTAQIGFRELTDEKKKLIADLAFWDASPLPMGKEIRIRGPIDENADFTRIRKAMAGEVVFDLQGVRNINSWGARQWILFLRSLPATQRYSFVNASEVFIKHCNMVADMLGNGAVLSFVAPYECQACGRATDRILQASSMSRAIREDPPEFRCGACGGIEKFSEMPDRYFLFLRDKAS